MSASELNELRERLRETAQILIAEVGADGPTNAEDAARMAVARMERLRELADEKAHEAGLCARRMTEAQEARNKAHEEERALVVAWLRHEAGLAQEHAPWDGSAHELLVQAAEIIGRGGHIPKKGEP
jgi:hypothetical protein